MSLVTAIRTESPRIGVSEFVKFQRASGECGAHTDGMKGRNDAEIPRRKHIQGRRRAGSVEASDRCSVSVEECQGCGQSGESMGASKNARLHRGEGRDRQEKGSVPMLSSFESTGVGGLDGFASGAPHEGIGRHEVA